jgi:hypothetical protein
MENDNASTEESGHTGDSGHTGEGKIIKLICTKPVSILCSYTDFLPPY